MALKDMMNPAALMAGVIEKMGLTPAIIQQFVNEIWSEFRAMKSDREGFKAACQATVPDIVARLDRIERNQAAILAALATPATPAIAEDEHGSGLINGHG